MTQEDGEAFGSEGIDAQDARDDEAGDPAQAFEALRQSVERQGQQIGAELSVVRKGVEAAFDRLEVFQPSPDYSVDLGRLVQGLAVVRERLKAIEVSPILKNGPEHYASAIKRSGEDLVGTAVQQLQSESRDAQQLSREMTAHIASARERRVQNRLLWVAGVASLAGGILVTLFVPSLLPNSLAPRVASLIMRQTPWNAGMSLMAFESSESWSRVAAAAHLIEANQAAVEACRDAAIKEGKNQQCAIKVAPAAR